MPIRNTPMVKIIQFDYKLVTVIVIHIYCFTVFAKEFEFLHVSQTPFIQGKRMQFKLETQTI